MRLTCHTTNKGAKKIYKYYVITENINELKGVLLREGFSSKDQKTFEKTGKEINDLFSKASCSGIKVFLRLNPIKSYDFHQIEVNKLRGIKKYYTRFLNRNNEEIMLRVKEKIANDLYIFY